MACGRLRIARASRERSNTLHGGFKLFALAARSASRRQLVPLVPFVVAAFPQFDQDSFLRPPPTLQPLERISIDVVRGVSHGLLKLFIIRYQLLLIHNQS